MAWKRRITRDIKDLIDNNFNVKGENDQEYTLNSFITTVKGPADSPYENCVWNVRFTITDGFPFTSPSVGFVQRIFHPNVDEESGSICLDALNKSWSPTFTIRHIVETVLPYLLSYPNPDDPLNRDAAHLLKTNKEGFESRVREHSKLNSLH
jgi:ubiquitin-conjugating enzyme E2 H